MLMRLSGLAYVSTVAALSILLPAAAQQPTEGRPVDGPLTADIPAKFNATTPAADYDRREVMIPMRDGVKLFTVIVVPKGASHAPILLTRTPYNAGKTTSRNPSQSIT